MTDAERSIWQILRSAQMDGHRFRRQVPFGPYIADFVCHNAHLIIEIDGGQHERFWNNEVLSNLEGVRAIIIRELRHHPHPNPPPSRGRE
jgi:very-short-patch-repair endonuclease